MTIKGPSENLFHRGGVDIKWNGPMGPQNLDYEMANFRRKSCYTFNTMTNFSQNVSNNSLRIANIPICKRQGIFSATICLQTDQKLPAKHIDLPVVSSHKYSLHRELLSCFDLPYPLPPEEDQVKACGPEGLDFPRGRRGKRDGKCVGYKGVPYIQSKLV